MSNKETKSLIRELRDTTGYWVKGVGPFNHIVISSRIRLARNCQGVPFPYKASNDQLKIVLDQAEKVIRGNRDFENFRIIRLNDLSAIDIQFLVEKRLISIAQAQFKRPYRALIFNPEEVLSIMVNEEDHFRIQCIQPGFQLKKVWELIDRCDNQIGAVIEYAFNENEGFLTCCPTNVGTGLRASVMMHLPALLIKNRLGDLLKTVSKQGYAVRGFYGEGTDFQGNLFQISNQATLGIKETEIMERLELICRQMIEKEQKARDELMMHSKQKIEDQVMRAYGILTNARMMTTTEALDLLSKVRFGIELGILTKAGYDTINRLMLIIQPCYLQLLKGLEMDKEVRDSTRALLIQELLK